MLKEIQMSEVIKTCAAGKEVIVLDGNTVRRFKEVFQGMRFLVDEEEEDVKHDYPEKRSNKAEDEILKAWNGGERSIKEIMEITGRSYGTVRKYIPVNENG